MATVAELRAIADKALADLRAAEQQESDIRDQALEMATDRHRALVEYLTARSDAKDATRTRFAGVEGQLRQFLETHMPELFAPPAAAASHLQSEEPS